ncbi:MAG: 30S ribosomal protein S17 [Bordetella sp.]|nr:MAG: 30S ribosomal protein S17 [Bordetella sp.]
MKELITDNMEYKKSKSTLIGKIISNKMEKSVVVKIERKVKHPIVGKIITLSAKYKAHDENNEYYEGDIVKIKECKPISRSKSWKVVQLIQKRDIL